jgi:hypothetical protein
LDPVFAGAELRRSVLLELDVQGYDTRVLRNSTETLKRLGHIVLETSFKSMYEVELLFMAILRKAEERDSRFERPMAWLAAPSSAEILQMDAFFVRASQMLMRCLCAS